MPADRAPSSRRPHRAWVVAVFALGVVLRLPTFSRVLLSDDEAIYATTADALSRGDLLYRDVVDHKPPLIYHVYQAGFRLLGPYNTHGAHALVVLAVLGTAAFLLAVARRSDREPTAPEGGAAGAGLAAASLFLIFSTTWHDYDALAANCELFLLLPQAAAALLLLGGLPAPGRALSTGGTLALARHLGVGVLIGMAALFKYQALTFLGASVGTLGWCCLLGRMAWPRAALLAGCHLLGAALPPALYLLVCCALHNAAAAVQWFQFNFSYVAAGLTGWAALGRALRRTAMIGGVAAVPYVLGIAAASATAVNVLRTVRARRSALATPPAPAAVFGLLWLGTAAMALSVGGRFFGHYFHLILAPLCLLAAPAFARLWNQGWRRRGPLVAALALPALVFFLLATVGRPLAQGMDGAEPPYPAVAARIAQLVAPAERLFVWGNSPQLYVLTRRPMGARFSFCNYMTGESPGTPTESGQRNADDNQLPGAWQMLFDDLERRRPTLFVDAAAAGWDGYDKYPLGRYPPLRRYVDAHYRYLESPQGVALYRRLGP